MKKYIHGLVMCQSMFCAIPFPTKIWDEEARDSMVLFLPVIGLEIGFLWAGLAWFCGVLSVPAGVRGLMLAVYPFLVTGFLHLDGFMDVSDAVGSCRSLERRREILKDSHVGAFAVIGIVLLVLSQYALFASAEETADFRIWIFVPAVSRCCSALAVKVLPPMTTSQYAGRKKQTGHITALLSLLALLLTAGVLMCGKTAWVLLGCLGAYGMALRKGYRSLEGMNGDISGYALTLSELGAAAVFALL